MPMVWGKMMLESNGLSYMDFKLQVDLNKAMDGMLKERLVELVEVHICTVYNLILLVHLLVHGWLECLLRWILKVEWRMKLQCSKLQGFTELSPSSNHPLCSGMKQPV